MGINPEAAQLLVSVAVPVFVVWFLVGITVAVLYHLSLYFLDGEYRVRPELSLDLLVGGLRGLAYVLVWPAIFYFGGNQGQSPYCLGPAGTVPLFPADVKAQRGRWPRVTSLQVPVSSSGGRQTMRCPISAALSDRGR
jgi:hypothetical protein